MSENKLELIGPEALSTLLKCSVRTLHNLVAAGTIPPAYKIGGRALWDVTEVKAALNKSRENAE